MRAYGWIVWRVVLMALLLVVAWRTGFLALYNWWAAGGPPTPDPSRYEKLAAMFSSVAIVCLASAATMAVDLMRDWRRANRRP